MQTKQCFLISRVVSETFVVLEVLFLAENSCIFCQQNLMKSLTDKCFIRQTIIDFSPKIRCAFLNGPHQHPKIYRNIIYSTVVLSSHINHQYLYVAGVNPRYSTSLSKCSGLHSRKLFSGLISQCFNFFVLKSFRNNQLF